jgi:hypothetical protein
MAVNTNEGAARASGVATAAVTAAKAMTAAPATTMAAAETTTAEAAAATAAAPAPAGAAAADVRWASVFAPSCRPPLFFFFLSYFVLLFLIYLLSISISYITSTTNFVYNRCSHSNKAKIWIFDSFDLRRVLSPQ